jgi:hypothetical protein
MTFTQTQAIFRNRPNLHTAKDYLDTTSALWIAGELEDRAYARMLAEVLPWFDQISAISKQTGEQHV